MCASMQYILYIVQCSVTPINGLANWWSKLATLGLAHRARQWRRNEFESSGAPVRGRKGRGTDPARSSRKNCFWSCPSTFLALMAQLVVLVSAFVMVSTVWSVSCLLFFYSRCSPCPAICKSGEARAPRASWSRRHRSSVTMVGFRQLKMSYSGEFIDCLLCSRK